jgi:3-(3-hydroxy-phenyl)propionate hydroxylase
MIDLSTTLGRILTPTHRSTALARDLFFRAATVAPGVRSWIMEMRFKARPFYQRGFVVPDNAAKEPRVGRMIIQPTVETTTKQRIRLDDALGSWFAVLGFECDPLSELDDTALAILDRLDARVVKVVESRAGETHHLKPSTRADTVVIEDADNQLRGWFQPTGRNVVVLRPDRYVAVLTTPGGLSDALRALCGRTTPVTA